MYDYMDGWMDDSMYDRMYDSMLTVTNRRKPHYFCIKWLIGLNMYIQTENIDIFYKQSP